MKKRIVCFVFAFAVALALCLTLAACVNPANVINKIEVTKKPSKTAYVEGQCFDPSGMVVKVTYGDDSIKPVTDYAFTPDAKTPLTKDVKKVIISYGDKETSVDITVSEKTVELLAVTKRPDKVAYGENEAFDPAGMELLATFNDGTTKALSSGDVTWEKTDNEKDIRISYGGATTIQPLRIDRDAANFGDAILSSDNTTQTGTVNFWNPADWQPFADDSAMTAPSLQSDGTLKFTDRNKMRFEAFRVPCKRWTDNKFHDGMDNIAADVGNSLDGTALRYSLFVRATGDYDIVLFANATLKLDYTGSYATGVQFSHTGRGFEIRTTEGGKTTLASAPDAVTGYDSSPDSRNRIDFEFTRKENLVTVKMYVDNVRIYFRDDNIGAHSGAALENGNFVFPAGKHDNSNTPEGLTNYKNCGHRICVSPAEGSEVYLGKV